MIVCLSATGARAGVEELTAPLVDKDSIPTVDGTVEAEEWQRGLSLHTGLVDARTKTLASQRVTVHMIADKEALYVGLVSPKMADELNTRDWERDDLDAALLDDRYELVVKPPVTPPIPWYHIIVNSAGNIYDHKGDPHRSDVFKTYNMAEWNGEWTFKQNVTDDEWHMEFRIPVSMFGDQRTEAQGQWEINVGRGRRNGKHFIGLQKNSADMARLRVVPDAPGLELHQLGNLGAGELDVVFKLEDPALKGDGEGRTMSLTCVVRSEAGGGNLVRENATIPVVPMGSEKTGGLTKSFTPGAKNTLMLLLWDSTLDANAYLAKIYFEPEKKKGD